VSRAEDWPWSSTRAQLAGEDDELTTVAPLRALIPDFAALLATLTDAATPNRIERALPSAARWGGRNGSRCSSAGSAALWKTERSSGCVRWMSSYLPVLRDGELVGIPQPVANIGLRSPDTDINQLRERCSPQALD
jgi:hypothetical protein